MRMDGVLLKIALPLFNQGGLPQKDAHRAGALVWWLWEETHVLKVVGSNPSTIYWMKNFRIYFL